MLGAGLQLSPNAMHVLNSLGLGRWITEAASTPQSIEIANGITGKKLTSLPLGERVKATFGAPYAVIHRADLQNILFNACKNDPNIEIHFSSEVVEMAPHANGVTTMIRQDQDVNELQAKGLIVADGVWSNLRTEVIGLEPPESSGKIAWRALIPVQDKEQENTTCVWFGPKSHVVSYPVRGGEYQNYVVITDGPNASSNKTITIDAEELKSRFDGWNGDFLSIFEKQARWTGWPLFETPKVKRMAYGPVAIIGDAAHAMLPFAAQGAAMAIEDAAVLAKQIDIHENAHDAFAAFEKERIPRVSKVLKTARANGRIYHLSGIRSEFRDLGMWLTPARLLSARQNWIYGWRP